MKNLTLIIAAFMFASFSFAQDAGQWSFGVGGDFTNPGLNDNTANVGYFVMDGLMVSATFSMNMDYTDTEDCTCVDVLHEDGDEYEVEGGFDWGMGMRYYAIDNVYLGANIASGDGEDPDMFMEAGVSLELAFDGKLFFEPSVRFDMPGHEYGTDSQNTFGLAWAFRYTF